LLMCGGGFAKRGVRGFLGSGDAVSDSPCAATVPERLGGTR
jgi:hypothetical protein